jgi:hypothetical protein
MPMNRPARGVSRRGPELSVLPELGGLFDFDVIARVHGDRTISDQHR